MSADIPPEAEELFALDLAEFSKRKNEIVKQLKAAGDKDAAAKVAALKKPAVSVWALNQVAGRNKTEIEQLLKADEALASPRSRKELRMASEKRHRIVSQLTQLAMEVLQAGGHAASATTANKISQTLLSIGADQTAREALAEGLLTTDLRPGGGAEDIWSLPDLPKEPATENDRSAEDAAKRQALEEETTRLTVAAQKAEKEANLAEDKARGARAEADRVEQEAAAARHKSDEAAAALARKTSQVNS